MKKIKSLLLLLVLGISCLAQKTPVIRAKLNFNKDWKFQLGDFKGAEQISFDDQSWQNVGLPHSFSIPYFMSPDFYVGYGWYRKQFDIPPHYADKKLFLEFEAAFQDAEIFVNGRKVGSHKGGYTGFSIDISDAVVTGKNMVAVRLNNLWNPRLAPRAGEHTFSGGLYRDVYLVVTEPVHVTWYGTFVTTPVVSSKNASVNITTEVKNSSSNSTSVKLRTDILSPDGKKVASVTETKTIEVNEVASFDQSIQSIKNPKLWDLNSPNLYTAVSTVMVNGQMQDEYRTSFGIRSVKFTSDKGFFLNEKHIYLLGANVHQDHAGWGDAVTNAGFYRDVKMMKNAGFNFIRGSHYPHDPSFVEACDQMGMLFWSENPFWGIGGSAKTPEGYWNSSAYPTQETDRDSFENSIEQELREMIHMYRNNPSVIAWSMSNEPFFTASQTIPAVRKLLKNLVDISHQEDPTRVAAIGGSQRPLDENRIDKLGDMAGYNGDGGSIPLFQNPGIPTIVSEYGSTTSDRPGNYEPGWGDLAKDNGQAVHDWRSGQAIWCGFDHGSIAGARLGKMGIVDYFRIPKRSWYWYRNEYLHIAPPEWPQPGTPTKLRLEADRKTSKTDGTEDIHLVLTVLDAQGKAVSNNPPVELKVVSGPGEFPTGSTIKFEEKSDIRILDGQAAIEFRSWYAGKTVIRATSPGLDSAEVVVNFLGETPFVQGVTPGVTERPYHRFSKQGQPNILQLFGLNNPTFGSSFMADHPTSFAADGNKKSWWQALANDQYPNWILDTEKRLSLLNINLTFPDEDVYRFKVEVSENMKDWKLVEDFMNNQQKINSKQITLSGIIGGAIRISFDKAAKAKLAEVEVSGKVVE
ncbi:MAG: glycoside hydrolase family 2 TIM barrel-domain containing protein [Bacteroidota bacterium]|nr:glycoside hydrolase family 2 TIM barrel-domain containing protein [Bacteroidota bacterium]